MTVTVPEGEHQVSLSLNETPLRLFSDIISIISLVALIVAAFFQRKNAKKIKKK